MERELEIPAPWFLASGKPSRGYRPIQCSQPWAREPKLIEAQHPSHRTWLVSGLMLWSKAGNKIYPSGKLLAFASSWAWLLRRPHHPLQLSEENQFFFSPSTKAKEKCLHLNPVEVLLFDVALNKGERSPVAVRITLLSWAFWLWRGVELVWVKAILQT